MYFNTSGFDTLGRPPQVITYGCCHWLFVKIYNELENAHETIETGIFHDFKI